MFKSITAVVLGVLLGAVLSLATDTIFEKLGIFPPLGTGLFVPWMLVLATLYRTIYTMSAGYLTHMLAPQNPKRHVTVLATLALVANIGGVVVGATHPELGPLWYPILLAVFAYPATWLGGKLHEEYLHSCAE